MPIGVRPRDSRTECAQYGHLHRRIPLRCALRVGGVAVPHECRRRRDFAREGNICQCGNRAHYHPRRLARGGHAHADSGRERRIFWSVEQNLCALRGASLRVRIVAQLLGFLYSVAHVTGSTFQTRMFEVQPHQLLVSQEPEACHAQNRAQKVLQMVQGAHEAQGGEEIVARPLAVRYTQPVGRLVKWYNFGLQNRRRRFDSYIARLRHDVALAKSDSPNLRRDFGVAMPAEGSRRRDMYYVYSLQCKDGYYVGCTTDLKDRVVRHTAGQVAATADRLPVKLVFYFALANKYKAFAFEKYLKSGSGRAFIKKHL